MTYAPRLVVFDSGMGGLTVARAIRARLPAAQLLYMVDNGGFPYGALSDRALQSRVAASIDAALAQIGVCDAVVIACNTASTTVLDHLRARHTVPIVGVVPAVKWAASISVSRQIGVLATAVTAQRPYLADLIERFAAHCIVKIEGAARLAEYAERDFCGEFVDDEAIFDEVAPLFAHADAPMIDKIALGCTHYPLLLPRLVRLFPGRDFLDPSRAVANRVASVALPQGVQEGWAGKLPPNRTLFTAKPQRAVDRLADEGLEFHSVIKI
jgi:glutamate racemase